MKTLILSVQDVAEIVQKVGVDTLMDAVIEGVHQASASYSEQLHDVPVRAGFDYDTPARGLVEWMPIMASGRQVTMKMVGYHPQNPTDLGLPTILSAILSFDTRSGHLNSLIDGTFATALRTGAASAVASRILAHPQSRIVGLIGAGAQAVTQLHALSRVFPITDVYVYDPDASALESLAMRLLRAGLRDIRIHRTPAQEVASNADILCTATSVPIGDGPVFADNALKPHLHVNAVGADFPGKVEVPQSLLKRALVCADFVEQAIKEGECQQLTRGEIGPDLAQLARAPHEYDPWRSGCTVFDSTGWALEDEIVADILLAKANALGIGSHMMIENQPADPKDPYDFGVRATIEKVRLA